MGEGLFSYPGRTGGDREGVLLNACTVIYLTLAQVCYYWGMESGLTVGFFYPLSEIRACFLGRCELCYTCTLSNPWAGGFGSRLVSLGFGPILN